MKTSATVSMFPTVVAKEGEPVEVSAVLDAIRAGRWQNQVEAVRAAFATEGKKAADALKRQLPPVTFSGLFNGSHKAESLAEHSGLLCLDFDGLNGHLDELRAKLAGDPHCMALFTSPSGTGLKLVIKIEPNAAEHGRVFDALRDYFKDKYGVEADKSGRDVCRLCFVSYDPELVHNPDAEPFTPEPISPPKPQTRPSFHDDAAPSRDKIENALRYVSADCGFDDWLRIGMALHSWSSSEGRSIWDSWSRTAPTRYEESAIDRHWKTFRPGPVTIATLFKMAVDAGWKPVRSQEQPHTEPEADEPWEKPIGFDAPVNLPPFPVDVLPEPFKAFVQDVANSKQVPVDLPGVLALAAVAIPAAKRFKVYIGQSHSEPLNIYVLSLLDPGSRKSDTFRALLSPVEDYEIEQARQAKPEMARAAERRAVEESRLTELRKRAGRCDDSAERQKLTIEAENMAAALTEIPTPPRLLASDISPENLATLLCANGGRMAVADSEGGLIFAIMGGRYSKNGAPNIEVFLKAHAGDCVRVDRSGRPPEFALSAALTCALTAQPCIIRDLAGKDQMRGRGLLARFLFSMPAGLIGQRKYGNQPMSPALVESYATRLAALLTVPLADPDDPEVCRRLAIRGDALSIWTQYHDQIEAAQAPDGELSHMTDFASKLPGAVARLSGILHLMVHGPTAPEQIEAATVAGAWALGFYFLDHTKAAFAEMGAGGDIGLARRVYGWIGRHRPDRFTLGVLFNDLRRGAGLDLSDDLMPAIEILEDRGVIRRETAPPSTKPGRKSFGSWIVHPDIVSGVII